MKDIKIVCLGDSITFGYELEASKRWTNLLSAELDVEVLNFGINGDTTSGMLARFQQHVIDQNPTHVIITGGTNDLWFGLRDEHIILNILTMSRQAKFYDIIPIVGIPTPSFNLNELNFVGEDYAECIRSFQNNLIKFCYEKEVPFINFSKHMDTNHFLDDKLHPNEEGHKMMGNNVITELEKIIAL